MTVLEKILRAKLETTVKNAREVAEKASLAALSQLDIEGAKPPSYLTEGQKDLRRRLRAHARALGDKRRADGSQESQHLVWEISYEHWHQMLFARFLAENNLLMWEPGVAVSLDDCRDMVEGHPELAMGAKSQWELAGRLAARMLPQVFKPNSPIFELNFSPEGQRELEFLLGSLSAEIFQASDSLGWVYQFWQSKRKDEVNQLEVKIGADELPAVTQLFTEPYMVEFLLHNSLGGWWNSRFPNIPCPVDLEYLRLDENGKPIIGTLKGWPDSLSEFRLLDPCCGSGHFLVSAFLLLVPIRIKAENLTVVQAVNSVLKDNLFGLEIDARCVEIAVFALALAAWTFRDENGDYLGIQNELPKFNIACCGLKIAGKADEWEGLVPKGVENSEYLKKGLLELHNTFLLAPILGSLLNPSKSNSGSLFSADFTLLEDLLNKALSTEFQLSLSSDSEELLENATVAQGLVGAAKILNQKYNLVITNVPYLARSKQDSILKDFCSKYYPEAKNDLANVFLERSLELAKSNGGGLVQVVMPQNWLFLGAYRKHRINLINRATWNFLARIGEGGFDSPQAAGAFVILISLTNSAPNQDSGLTGIDASLEKSIESKITALTSGDLIRINQLNQLKNPDGRIVFGEQSSFKLLSEYADGLAGICTGDYPRFGRNFWEVPCNTSRWSFQQTTVEDSCEFGGLTQVLNWEQGNGELIRFVSERLDGNTAAWIRGLEGLGKQGVLVSSMRQLPVTRFLGELVDNNAAFILPKDPSYLLPILAFCKSPEYSKAVRLIDQKLNVTNATLVKVPFDFERWSKVALDEFPEGALLPYSDNPTQWIFHGHPKPSTHPLQVAVMRLLGFKWPVEMKTMTDLDSKAYYWSDQCQKISHHVQDDGILCLPSVRGELPAHERLLALLIEAWEQESPGVWRGSVLDKLVADTGCPGMSLNAWLIDKFFEQHSKIFQHRPCIWHIWDGQRDGFSAFINYQTFDMKSLEKLIHTYLGDWISQQEVGSKKCIDGAEIRLLAAKNLKEKLELILEGEKPFDIFVRWKGLEKQPIGWAPDINDGVRVNIRPFAIAEVLRNYKKPKLNIGWEKDRGKDFASSPWFYLGKSYGGEVGDRVNCHHTTLAEKMNARNG